MAEGAVKKGWELFKNHWGTFLVVGGILVIGALWWDHKKNGGLTQQVAGLPIIGRLFAA